MRAGTGVNDETIQGGIDAAAGGDTVNVETGTYADGLTTVDSKNITLAAGSSPGQVTVDGDVTLEDGDTQLPLGEYVDRIEIEVDAATGRILKQEQE